MELGASLREGRPSGRSAAIRGASFFSPIVMLSMACLSHARRQASILWGVSFPGCSPPHPLVVHVVPHGWQHVAVVWSEPGRLDLLSGFSCSALWSDHRVRQQGLSSFSLVSYLGWLCLLVSSCGWRPLCNQPPLCNSITTAWERLRVPV